MRIVEVHAKSRGTYGAPRVHAVLKRQGAGCGRRRVARLMRAAGLQGRHRRRRHVTTIPDPGAASRPDLIVRDFQPDRTGLDARWCGDITYAPTEEGWLYPATVIDIAFRARSRLGNCRSSAGRAGCRGADSRLQAASPHPSRDHPSDRGCQYTSRQLGCPAVQFGIRLSAGRTGQCWDNALAESFFSTIERELLGTFACPSRAAAHTAIFDFIEGWYNLHRLHSSLGYLSPAEYETAFAA
ncbi:IS3 family transposase [Streptomyces sp. NPDC000351]|uniref:IS3 family transposase n=1 Tax=Streptomyces sp. NPDC000351 TaxID=3154250 RepID=UPI003326893E